MNIPYNNSRILIIDDDEDDFIITSDYIRAIQGNKFVIDWCNTYSAAVKHLQNSDYDLYFVDYRLGAKSGVDFLKEAISLQFEEPIILLTGQGNYDVDIQAMKLGAVDYLVKTDLTTEKLERSIRYALDHAVTLKALRTNERKYRSIFENSKDVVFMADFTLDFKDVNAAVFQLLGYTRDEVVRMNLCEFIGKEQHKQILQYALLHDKGLNDWEVALTARNGEQKQCVLTITIEENCKGESYLQGIIHDITNLKKEEAEKLQAEKLAAAGRLVRTLAHEVRNPLNNITLSVEQISQLISDEQQVFYLDIIQRNGRRINSLITELLNTSGPAEHNFSKVALQQIVDDVVDASIDRQTLKHIKLQLDYPEVPLEIMADREKLKLALLNIVINAIESMAEHKGQLVMQLVQAGQKAVLTISDNGCGISEENVPRLFEPYFTQKRNGVGLGLTFTLNILQSHQAKIDVSSVLGQGTTFVISFPIETGGSQ